MFWCIPVVVPWMNIQGMKKRSPTVLCCIEEDKKQKQSHELWYMQLLEEHLHRKHHQWNGSIDQVHPGTGCLNGISIYLPSYDLLYSGHENIPPHAQHRKHKNPYPESPCIFRKERFQHVCPPPLHRDHSLIYIFIVQLPGCHFHHPNQIFYFSSTYSSPRLHSRLFPYIHAPHRL